MIVYSMYDVCVSSSKNTAVCCLTAENRHEIALYMLGNAIHILQKDASNDRLRVLSCAMEHGCQ